MSAALAPMPEGPYVKLRSVPDSGSLNAAPAPLSAEPYIKPCSIPDGGSLNAAPAPMPAGPYVKLRSPPTAEGGITIEGGAGFCRESATEDSSPPKKPCRRRDKKYNDTAERSVFGRDNKYNDTDGRLVFERRGLSSTTKGERHREAPYGAYLCLSRGQRPHRAAHTELPYNYNSAFPPPVTFAQALSAPRRRRLYNFHSAFPLPATFPQVPSAPRRRRLYNFHSIVPPPITFSQKLSKLRIIPILFARPVLH